MFLFALGIFVLTLWILPWWGLVFVAAGLGWILPGKLKRTLQIALAAALASMASAYVLDGRSYGMISKRMSGVFNLPGSLGIFVVVGVLAAVTATLGYRAGIAILTTLRPQRIIAPEGDNA